MVDETVQRPSATTGYAGRGLRPSLIHTHTLNDMYFEGVKIRMQVDLFNQKSILENIFEHNSTNKIGCIILSFISIFPSSFD